MHAYIHTHTHMCTHTYMQISLVRLSYPKREESLASETSVYVWAHIVWPVRLTYTHTHTRTDAHACTHTHTHTHTHLISLEPRLSFVGGKESRVYTFCTCVSISRIFSVKLSRYYQWARDLYTYLAVSGENTKTKINPRGWEHNCLFSFQKTMLSLWNREARN